MDYVTLQKMIMEIINEEILFNPLYWFITLCVYGLVGAGGAYIATYYGTKAKNDANSTNFEKILEQLEKQTRITDSIKTSISHDDWVNKEYKTLRKAKLEVLVETMFELRDEQWSLYSDALLRNSFNDVKGLKQKSDYQQKIHCKIRMLLLLYFPELNKFGLKVLDVDHEFLKINLSMYEQLNKISELDINEAWPLAYGISEGFKDEVGDKYSEILDSIAIFNIEASKIMSNLISVPQKI